MSLVDLRTLEDAPVALETYLTVSGINARASLSLAEREVVQLTAETTHGCGFCVAGHTAIAKNKAKLPENVIEALRARGELPDTRYDAIAAFTREVIATRGAVNEDALNAFLRAGFEQQQALEVILGVSLATDIDDISQLGGEHVAVPFWYSIHNLVVQRLLREEGLTPISAGPDTLPECG